MKPEGFLYFKIRIYPYSEFDLKNVTYSPHHYFILPRHLNG